MRNTSNEIKTLFNENQLIEAKNINGYLLDFDNVYIGINDDIKDKTIENFVL